MKTAIIGCGGHARSVADVINHNNPDSEIVFYDEHAKPDEEILGRCRVCLLETLNLEDFDNYVIALGDNEKRLSFARRFIKYEHKCISVISQSAYIGWQAKIGRGTVILEGAHIGPESNIGDYCIINTNAVVEHECDIGDYSHISVGSVMCGRSGVGRLCLVGASACIIDGIRLADNIVVGAGGTVVYDLNESGVYVGIPARKVMNSGDNRNRSILNHFE